MDAFDRLEALENGSSTPITTNKKSGDAFDRLPDEPEGFWKSSLRTILQIPKGIAEATPYGIAANALQFLGTDAALDPEEIDQIRRISEQQGIPFDEEAYMESVQKASEQFPTVSNLAKLAEKETGVPLEAKTKGQKFLEFASSAAKLSPKGYTFRGAETPLPRPILGAGVAGTAEAAKALGVPEPIADIASFAVLKKPPEGSVPLSFTKEKPSGLKERGFESLKSPREVSASKLEKVNKAVEKDFKQISDKIISESPVGETYKNLINDPTYKQTSRDLLHQAQIVADTIPSSNSVSSKAYKTELADLGAKAKKGFMDSEYDKSYNKFLSERIKQIKEGRIHPSKLVEQYRKNNSELGEYFEPGASKAFNRAKRDALLDSNRAIANVMEKTYPESELVKVFKEGNDRWTKIMDAETIDGFISDLFEGKINFKKGERFFDDPNTGRIFKRALKENYPQFEQLMKDMMTSEVPYKQLIKAKEKGFGDLFQTAKWYILHPVAGTVKTASNLGKDAYKFLINSLLEKPKLTINWSNGVKNLKNGDFKAAERDFSALKENTINAEEAFKKYTEFKKTKKSID